MSVLVDRLRQINSELQNFVDKNKQLSELLEGLVDAARSVGEAWCGSWSGYHANVYYADFKPPPPEAYWNKEFGRQKEGYVGFRSMPAMPLTVGDWRDYEPEVIQEAILMRVRDINLLDSVTTNACAMEKEGRNLFEMKRSAIVSTLTIALATKQDPYINKCKEQVEKQELNTVLSFMGSVRPSNPVSYDYTVKQQGIWTPPHISILVQVSSYLSPFCGCERLLEIAEEAANHIELVEITTVGSKLTGKKVFIGHGQSLVWMVLKEYLNKDKELVCDEYNMVPVAGLHRIERLEQMLNDAAMAFLVMTGEDETQDGKMNARLNVIHEVGLFQGKLGFTRAIILLEKGCDEFSNITGLEQIRFSKGNIKSAFYEVEGVLKREGLLPD